MRCRVRALHTLHIGCQNWIDVPIWSRRVARAYRHAQYLWRCVDTKIVRDGEAIGALARCRRAVGCNIEAHLDGV
jgi:hypothetical protein